jgi:hypothetical protein
MNTPNVRVSALSRLQDAGKEQLRTVQHYFERRNLEASLASLMQAANGHEVMKGEVLLPDRRCIWC